MYNMMETELKPPHPRQILGVLGIQIHLETTRKTVRTESKDP